MVETSSCFLDAVTPDPSLQINQNMAKTRNRQEKNVVRGKKSQTSDIPSSQRVQISKASYCCGQQTTPRPLPWRTWGGRMGDGGVIDLRVLI